MSTVLEKSRVETEMLTLFDVRDRNMGFVIPSYQRPYVWSNEDVVKLFDDIKEAFICSEDHYFIGNALTAQHLHGHEYLYELIDGQQRITTLMLVSIAFKSAGVDCDLAQVSIRGKEPRLTFEIRDSVRNLLGSFAGLEEMTKPGPDAIKNDDYLIHLAANLEVLLQLVTTLVKNKQFDIRRFADYIYKKVSWINNIVPDAMDLNRLFSSMNTAGIQLEPVDLLKAKLFRVLTSEKKLYSKIWQVCEHTDNYFERNLRQLFPNVDWNALQYNDLSCLSEIFSLPQEMSSPQEQATKTLAMLLTEVKGGDHPANVQENKVVNSDDEIEDETVYCRSVIAFELLLIHSLRIYSATQGWPDLTPRIKASNLMVCFEHLLKQSETTIKEFIQLLWQVRYQFDKWVVKWVEHDDAEDPQLRLTAISRSTSKGKTYFNRAALELSPLVQLQAVRYFTGDRSAHYWLTAFLAHLLANPDQDQAQVLAALEQIDNQLSLTTETQKEASFKIAQGKLPEQIAWPSQASYFDESKGTGFEHYWFQKLEYLLWKNGDKNDDKLKRYRITSKNSVEHVHPQNEEYKSHLPTDSLDAFGNLVLLSPGENSSYSNQTVLKKKADFDSKPRYDSLKLKELFATYEQANNAWSVNEIEKHQLAMLEVLKQHYVGAEKA